MCANIQLPFALLILHIWAPTWVLNDILNSFDVFLGPTDDIPVKVTGNVKAGFTAEFVPMEVGIHMILVEYNGVAVGGTPFYSKAYDSENVVVSDVTKNVANSKTVTFAGKGFRYFTTTRPAHFSNQCITMVINDVHPVMAFSFFKKSLSHLRTTLWALNFVCSINNRLGYACHIELVQNMRMAF